jgi:Type I phosphodiesterase / nucleotide pyrophosphatase/Chitobiase/beta-hexosaminidase C-terminal domain/PA14 domain
MEACLLRKMVGAWMVMLVGVVSVAAAEPMPGIRHVVVIGVDGMSPAGVEAAKTPVMNGLIAEGAYTFKARAVFPTSSSSNWMSMISGAGPEQHGVTSNEWELGDHTVVPTETGVEPIFPTMFSRLKAAQPDAKIVVVHHWDGFTRLFEHSVCDVALHRESAAATTVTAVDAIVRVKPTLTFIHLDHVDGAGHGIGWETQPYLEAVTMADAMIGQVIDALKQAGMWDSTLLIVSSDHGGIYRSHGGESMDEIEIPWIIHGPGVAKGRKFDASVNTTDTAATVALALGFKLAPSAVGRGVVEAFEMTPEGPGVGKRVAYVPAPRLLPRRARGVDAGVKVTLGDEVEGVEIRYTTDGTTPTRESKMYSGPIDVEKSTQIRAVAFQKDGQSAVSHGVYRVVRTEEGKGASYEVFPGSFSMIPSFDGLKAVKSGVVPEMDFEDLKVPVEGFAARFRAKFVVEKEGDYQFWTESDDGSQLFINGKRVVNNDGDHGPRLRRGTVELKAGEHAVEVRYFNGGGSGVLKAASGEERRLMEHAMLKPAPF